MLRTDHRVRIRYPYHHQSPLTYRTQVFPPPDRLSGDHPEPVKLPVKFRFVRNVNHRDSPPLAQRVAVHFICIVFIAVYLLFPPLLPIVDTTAAGATPLVRLLHQRRPYPYRRASRQAVPLHLSLISPIYLYYSVALGICCCYVIILFNCIACDCRPLITFPLSYAALCIYYNLQLALHFVSS